MSDATTKTPKKKPPGNRTDRRGRGPLSQQLDPADSKVMFVTVSLPTHAVLVEAAKMLNLSGVGILARWLLEYDAPEDAAARYLDRARRAVESEG